MALMCVYVNYFQNNICILHILGIHVLAYGVKTSVEVCPGSPFCASYCKYSLEDLQTKDFAKATRVKKCSEGG